jgi:hypothetical protein
MVFPRIHFKTMAKGSFPVIITIAKIANGRMFWQYFQVETSSPGIAPAQHQRHEKGGQNDLLQVEYDPDYDRDNVLLGSSGGIHRRSRGVGICGGGA